MSWLAGWFVTRSGLNARMHHHPDRLSASTARAQYGVINHRQLQAAGLGTEAIRHRRESGRLERRLPKTLRVGGAPSSWEQDLSAALLWAGEGAVISHRSAAALWGLDGCRPDVVELTSHRLLRSQLSEGLVCHRYSTLEADEITTIGPLRLTTPPRTLLDLAAVVPHSRLEVALDSCLRRRLATLEDLQATLHRHARCGRRGVRSFRAALTVRSPGYRPPHSALERKLGRLIASSQLPRPVREHPVVEAGREIYRIDFAYPEQMLAIEADGWMYHSDRIAWSSDQVRANVLTVRGWRVLRFTAHDLTKRPSWVIETISIALGAT